MFTDNGKDIVELLNKVGIVGVQFGEYDENIGAFPLLLDLDNNNIHPHLCVKNGGNTIDYTFHYYRLNDNGCLEIGTERRTHGDNDGESFAPYSLSQLEEEILPPLIPTKVQRFLTLIKGFLAHFRSFKIKHS